MAISERLLAKLKDPALATDKAPVAGEWLGRDDAGNVRFLAMASHYVFEPEFCNPASGSEKQVEKNVQDARHRFFHLFRAFHHWMP